MIKEITSKDEWNAILKQVDSYDFYHTYDYHIISCNLNNEEPILLLYTTNNVIIALPLILRIIPNTKYYDFTSIYGYAGPLSKNVSEDFDNTSYLNALQNYFQSKNIVSIFSRLHPYFKYQAKILSNFGEIIPLGRVVNIDVTLPLDESRKAYQKSLKNQVNKLRKTCIVRKAKTKTDVLEFIEIYHENMRRVNANEDYFFSTKYFFNLLNQSDFKTEILLVEEKESKKIIAGSMFIKTNGFVQFHLSGTKTEYLRLRPSKLFLDEMRIEATNQNFKYFNLGGGLGSIEDSLFEFKSAFSKDFRTFKIWRYIINQDVYDQLASKVEITNDNEYFPLYRIK